MDKDQTKITQNEIYRFTNYVLNSFSLLFSSLLLATIIILRIKKVNFSKRISLCLIMYVSITEIFSSIFHMLRIDSYRYSMWISYMSSWGCVLSTLLICFLILSILANIHISLVYNFKDLIYLRKYYFLISIAIAIILSVLPVFFGKFAFDQERHHFWYTTAIWEWLTYNGWITLSVLYCITIIIFVFYRLNKKPKRTSQMAPDEFNVSIILSPLSKQPTQSKLLSKYISRIAFYSLIPILSYSPAIVSNLVHYYSNNNGYSGHYVFGLLSSIFMSSQGIFTFTIFLFDPIVDEVILEHKRNLKHKKNVLDNIKKGVYVNDIYNVNLELPVNRNKNENRNYKRATIGKRISGITSILYNNNKMESMGSIDVKNIRSVFNLDEEEGEALLDLL